MAPASRFLRVVVGLSIPIALTTGCAQVSQLPGMSGLAPQSAPPATATAEPLPPPFQGVRKRLAVIKLENKTKTPLPDASWLLGEGLTEMLTTELFRTGRFVMVERAALAEVVKEQELGQTGLVQKETAAQVGELLGAQLLVSGAVTEFEESAKGGGTGINVGGLLLGFRGRTSHVAIDIRLVDVSTGEIVKSYNASGKAEETGFAIASTRTRVPIGTDGFNKTPLGQAAREAIAKAVGFIVAEMATVPWSGQVVQARGNEVFVNAGSNMNLQAGARFAVYSKGDELRDPATGKVLGSRDTHIGELILRDVQERFSVGTYRGNQTVKRGDLLRQE